MQEARAISYRNAYRPRIRSHQPTEKITPRHKRIAYRLWLLRRLNTLRAIESPDPKVVSQIDHYTQELDSADQRAVAIMRGSR